MNYLNRKFDKNGLLLAEYQGKLFEESVDSLKCSSPIFIRKFSISDLADDLDKNESSLVSLDLHDGINSIKKQFNFKNVSSNIKYNKEAMFWIGYLYRYVSYTRSVPTSFVIDLFDYKELYRNYYVYHTQDMEWIIKSLLEKRSLTNNYFNPNYRYKKNYLSIYN